MIKIPSPYSNVGFDFEGKNFYEELERISTRNNTREYIIGDGRYKVTHMNGDSDIRIWFGINPETNKIEPYDINLHYNTHKETVVTNPRWFAKTKTGATGILELWDKNKQFRFNIFVPNARTIQSFLPDHDKKYHCQLACFVLGYEIFKNETELSSELGTMTAQSFTTIGGLKDDSPYAWIKGYIRRIDLKTNPYTSKKYYHMVVESYAMSFDVLLGADYVNTEISVGDIISAEVMLSGEISDRYFGEDYGRIERERCGKSKIKTLDELYDVLCECWSEKTAHPTYKYKWNKNNPEMGQDAVTALVIYYMFGGKIYRIDKKGGYIHYFNEVNGNFIDMCSEYPRNWHRLYGKEYSLARLLDDPDTKRRFKILTKEIAKKTGCGIIYRIFPNAGLL